MQKKLINQKTRLKIWRAVRRRMKVAAKAPHTSEYGLCRALLGEGRRILQDPTFCETSLEIDVFPEMRQFKPSDCSYYCDYWWPFDLEGYQVRLEVCNEIIKKLEYKK